RGGHVSRRLAVLRRVPLHGRERPASDGTTRGAGRRRTCAPRKRAVPARDAHARTALNTRVAARPWPAAVARANVARMLRLHTLLALTLLAGCNSNKAPAPNATHAPMKAPRNDAF